MYAEQNDGHHPPPTESKRKRFGEPRKFLPVFFCLFTIGILYSIFLLVHLLPMLQVGVPLEHRDDGWRQQGIMQFAVFHVLTLMLILSYFQSVYTSPGEIPDNDLQWEYIPQDVRFPRADANSLNLQETKRSGDRRHCKWCGKYKPDRCHHCRVCRTCVLKMDHHCPWIYNCVGHGNYKYFFLLLMYSVADLHLIFWAQGVSVKESIEVDKPFMTMFLLMFGETLAFFIGFLLSGFLCFHVWLMFKAMTTIEFCEKSMPKRPKASDNADEFSGMRSAYDDGFIGNIAAVLGVNPLLWFLPFTPSPGNGLQFVPTYRRTADGGDGVKGYKRKSAPREQRRENSRGDSRDRDRGGGNGGGGTYGAYGTPDESLGGANYYGHSEAGYERPMIPH